MACGSHLPHITNSPRGYYLCAKDLAGLVLPHPSLFFLLCKLVQTQSPLLLKEVDSKPSLFSNLSLEWDEKSS